MVEKGTEKSDASIAPENYDSSDVLIASTTSSLNQWILDSRCSYHMSPCKDWFHDFKNCNGGQIILGNWHIKFKELLRFQ